MASPLTSDGYQDLRETVYNDWTFLALVDDTGTEVTRIDVVNDTRASFSSDATTNPVEITVTVTGGDSDITTPVTIDTTESYRTSSATTPLAADTFTNATLEASNDELTITHQIEIPPQ